MFGVTTTRGTVLKCPIIRKTENSVLEDSSLMKVLPILFNLLTHSLLLGGKFIFCLTLPFFLLCSLPFFVFSNPKAHKEYTYCGNDFLNHKGDVTQCLFFSSLTHRILAMSAILKYCFANVMKSVSFSPEQKQSLAWKLLPGVPPSQR